MKMTEAEKWQAGEERLPNVERSATAARYDGGRHALVLVLRSGAELAIPIASIAALAKASPEQLSGVALESDGMDLRWDELDVDLLVVGLVRDATGEAAAYRNVGRAKTPAKTAAARANGAKGGRPRKAAATA
jgi:hypothetical protein